MILGVVAVGRGTETRSTQASLLVFTGVLRQAVSLIPLVFTNDEPAAKKLLDRFHKVQFKPAKLRGEPIPSCGAWWGTAVRMRSP